MFFSGSPYIRTWRPQLRLEATMIKLPNANNSTNLIDRMWNESPRIKVTGESTTIPTDLREDIKLYFSGNLRRAALQLRQYSPPSSNMPQTMLLLAVFVLLGLIHAPPPADGKASAAWNRRPWTSWVPRPRETHISFFVGLGTHKLKPRLRLRHSIKKLSGQTVCAGDFCESDRGCRHFAFKRTCDLERSRWTRKCTMQKGFCGESTSVEYPNAQIAWFLKKNILDTVFPTFLGASSAWATCNVWTREGEMNKLFKPCTLFLNDLLLDPCARPRGSASPTWWEKSRPGGLQQSCWLWRWLIQGGKQYSVLKRNT